ncbi:uncharacterized protein LOC128591761 isoform X6 [Nycticebus coucang]|nr:uncharacterized protein LOC128591761 isoform X6 [Nycticebus coucang]
MFERKETPVCKAIADHSTFWRKSLKKRSPVHHVYSRSDQRQKSRLSTWSSALPCPPLSGFKMKPALGEIQPQLPSRLAGWMGPPAAEGLSAARLKDSQPPVPSPSCPGKHGCSGGSLLDTGVPRFLHLPLQSIWPLLYDPGCRGPHLPGSLKHSLR